jgi:hypothetical protein
LNLRLAFLVRPDHQVGFHALDVEDESVVGVAAAQSRSGVNAGDRLAHEALHNLVLAALVARLRKGRDRPDVVMHVFRRNQSTRAELVRRAGVRVIINMCYFAHDCLLHFNKSWKCVAASEIVLISTRSLVVK